MVLMPSKLVYSKKKCIWLLVRIMLGEEDECDATRWRKWWCNKKRMSSSRRVLVMQRQLKPNRNWRSTSTSWAPGSVCKVDGWKEWVSVFKPMFKKVLWSYSNEISFLILNIICSIWHSDGCLLFQSTSVGREDTLVECNRWTFPNILNINLAPTPGVKGWKQQGEKFLLILLVSDQWWYIMSQITRPDHNIMEFMMWCCNEQKSKSIGNKRKSRIKVGGRRREGRGGDETEDTIIIY